MPSTRRSTRLSSSQESSPPKQTSSPKAAAGTKRKPETSSSPIAKRGRKDAPKQQTTIEDSMDVDDTEASKPETNENGTKEASEQTSTESAPAPAPSSTQNASDNPAQNGHNDSREAADKPDAKAEKPSSETQNDETARSEPANKAQTKPQEPASDNSIQQQEADKSKMDNTGAIKSSEQPKSEEKQSTNGDSAIEAHDRDDETPASILEKGLIYFFFRGRVGIDNPSDVNDIARSYMILRPIPHGAKLGDGPIGDGAGKCRLLALPKKVLPLSGKDKFMTFVETAKTSFSELKESFMAGSDYSTNTAGVRHTPAVTPIAEGVYAITTTGRESHLAYMVTIPQELGEVQKDIGLREQGSFVTSVKNPQHAGPANTNLPQGPDFPKEILDEFRSLRWSPLQPKHLDYENVQFLLIGESSGIDNALEPQQSDKEGTKEEMKEEMEKLEGEDEIRIKNLKGDDSIFVDLGISHKEYNLQTTW